MYNSLKTGDNDSVSCVRTATPADLPHIVAVHRAAFPAFFLTQLGPAFLNAYYGLVLSYEGGILMVAEYQGRVGGFVAGIVGPGEFYRRMSQQRLRFGRLALCGLITRPTLLLRVVGKLRHVQKKRDVGPANGMPCELTSIGVDPACSGRGIGRQLVLEFVDAARAREATEVTLTTDARDNARVNTFYQRTGFQLKQSFEVARGRLMNEYRLVLQRSETAQKHGTVESDPT